MSEASDVFRQIADVLPQIVWELTPEGRIAWVNRRFIEVAGRDVASEFAIDDAHLAEFIHPDDLPRLGPEWLAAFAAGSPYEYEFRMLTATGTYRWFLAYATPYRDAAGAIDAWFGVSTDIDDRKRTTDMLGFLAEASGALNSSRDVDAALDRAAGLAVPRIADWCAVYLREPNGYFRAAAIHHGDPAKVQLAIELLRRYPLSVDTERELMQKRVSLIYPVITTEMIDAGAIDGRHASIMRELDLASAIVVPLLIDDEVTGMLHLVRGVARESFRQADVDLAEILASRIAVAIDNAIVYERERNVATTFQNAALPQSLPRIDGVVLHSAYRTGDTASSVGGDWYDAVELRDGSLLISIGDVAGKGLDAAVLMASMRQAIRVAGLQGLAPNAVLEAANAALYAEHSGRFVTAFVGRIDVAGGRLEYANAGHPAPLIRETGGLRALELGDPPLGVWDAPFAAHAIDLRAPWLIVAFTDGLIERTGDVVAGEALVRTVVADDGILHAANPAAYLQARLLRGPVRDDAAILTIRADDDARWRFGADDALRAEPTRRTLTKWLAERTRVDAAAAELIYGELVSNVVRHAPGPIDVDVMCSDDAVRLFVQSGGDPIVLAPQLPASPFSETGRGLFIVDALGERLAAAALPVFGNQVAVDLPTR